MGRPLDPNSKRWQAMRQRILKRDGYRCQACSTGLNLTAHHIKPRKYGGKTNEKNLLALCGPCHDFVELHELTWEGIINMRKDKAMLLDEDLWDSGDGRVVGRDKYGVFVIHGETAGKYITYDGLWPRVVRERPYESYETFYRPKKREGPPRHATPVVLGDSQSP